MLPLKTRRYQPVLSKGLVDPGQEADAFYVDGAAIATLCTHFRPSHLKPSMWQRSSLAPCATMASFPNPSSGRGTSDDV